MIEPRLRIQVEIDRREDQTRPCREKNPDPDPTGFGSPEIFQEKLKTKTAFDWNGIRNPEKGISTKKVIAFQLKSEWRFI